MRLRCPALGNRHWSKTEDKGNIRIKRRERSTTRDKIVSNRYLRVWRYFIHYSICSDGGGPTTKVSLFYRNTSSIGNSYTVLVTVSVDVAEIIVGPLLIL